MQQFPPPGSHLNRRPGPGRIASPLAPGQAGVQGPTGPLGKQTPGQAGVQPLAKQAAKLPAAPRPAPRAPAPVLLFSLEKTMKYLRSAAMSRAMAESCNLEWKTYDDSMVINAIYALMPWKEKPGSVEMKMAGKEELGERYGHYLRKYVTNWTTAMFMGPVAVKTCLDRIDLQRERDRAHIAQVAQDVREINAEVANQLGDSIKVLASIKLASTILVAGISGGAAVASVAYIGTPLYAGLSASAGTLGAINTAYSITGSIVSNWYKSPTAKAVGVTVEGVKAAGGKIGGDVGEAIFKGGKAAMEGSEAGMSIAAARMNQAREGFMNAARHRGRANARRAFEKGAQQMTQAVEGVNQARRTMSLGSKVVVGAAVFFAAVDIYQGIGEFSEDISD